MAHLPWTLHSLRRALLEGATRPFDLAEQALAHSNQNQSHNTYLWQNPTWTRSEAARAEATLPTHGGSFGTAALCGLPISVKDCFNLAGAPTSCGTRFYRERDQNATRDSWLVEQLRSVGAVIIGKTHLHPLAYGITGENPEFGDCLQPGNPSALTGGSSSGAVASVLEGSAVAAIGTDTGGSIRVPAALCGLAGYRATLGRGDWRGGAHLAESFDTMGWLFRDLEDAPLLAAPFAGGETAPLRTFTRFAYLDDSFLHDCEPGILDSFRQSIRELNALGLAGHSINPDWWQDAAGIFAPIQAFEASRLHAGQFDRFQPAIRERLAWGASIDAKELAGLRKRHAQFRDRMDELFLEYELILLPCAPVARLESGADHSRTRAKLLRYTTPISLAGSPAIAIPYAVGGMQLTSARGLDESLLALAARLAPGKS